MGRKRKLRYPTTTEIVDFIYNDQSLRSSIISLQNKLIELDNPGDFIAWADDTLNWDIACDLKHAFEQGKLVPVLPEKVPFMLREQDCRNVIELVYALDRSGVDGFSIQLLFLYLIRVHMEPE